ncbi:hypothetical protein [Mycobacterium shimoidei]|uniref:hypothetical protein n=1 Tax=Mycobacterium shimoidei TaxID=29313 RepID=UPI000848B6C1|nr:hypothetical protein [Mycobacterium shimoidei]MCV7258242.1 hypothetical protein [Mycobacterium shimoidei]ODR12929.1 hypothetical protein BHQ16_12730 [Mycobacterium shimoidei]ORW82077.1 hypothetical protein AWC26_05310 [Mycobacterium shimoidei]
MKLARPDIRHPRIVLAGVEKDDAGLVTALRKRGLHARWMSWEDADTLHADLVILRESGHDRRAEFLAWTKRVAHLLNAPNVVAWNLGRRYLRDLENAGVPTAKASNSAIALVFFAGGQSHAFTAQGAVDADFELWDVGHAALRAAARQLRIDIDELLYARADVTDDARLVRLDLVAPRFGWELLDNATRQDAQRQFAIAVESALERLGLGPLSHRRP